MRELLEAYLYEHHLESQPQVQSYSIDGNICTYAFNTEYNSNEIEYEVSVWQLLEFLFDRKKDKTL